MEFSARQENAQPEALMQVPPRKSKWLFIGLLLILLFVASGVYLYTYQKKKSPISSHVMTTGKKSANTVYNDIKRKLQESLK